MIFKNLKSLVTAIDNDDPSEFFFKENRDGVNDGCGLRKVEKK